MNKVKIQTLTPIHIGSGEFLKNNSDFVEYKDGGDSYISIIDPKKILDLISAGPLLCPSLPNTASLGKR